MHHFYRFLCFGLRECYLLDFREPLLSFACMLAYTSTVLVYFASHCFRMHDIVLHKRLPIRQLVSHTCMFFHFLNLAFVVYMHDHSLLLTFSLAMNSHLHMLSYARRRV